jgi:phage tail-like protein
VRERPCGGANFLVEFGAGDAHAASAGFAEVVFPTFTLDVDEASKPGGTESHTATASQRLVLKRGVTGSLDLYAWWNKARRGKAPQRRSVKIMLLAEDRASVVLTWHFRNARPVSLAYSPLRALEGGIVMETLELAFDTMEIS